MARTDLLAGLTLVLLLSTGCQQDTHRTQTPTNHSPPQSTGVAEAFPTPPGLAINAGLTSAEPYTVLVLGDSTGNNTDEWVHRIGKRIAANYQRAVTIHDWSDTVNGYITTTAYGDPGQPPVTIWNGSAAGKGPSYSESYYASMAPERADLTLINHGHNGEAKDIVSGDERLIQLIKEAGTPDAVIAVMLQNPRVDSPAKADMLQRGVNLLRQRFGGARSGVTLIDVHSAFPHDAGLTAYLRPDGIHPNERGQQLWADTVAAALQLR